MVKVIKERLELANDENKVVAHSCLDPTCRVARARHPKRDIPDKAVALAEVRPTIIGSFHQELRAGGVLITTRAPFTSEAFTLHNKPMILRRVTDRGAGGDSRLADRKQGVEHSIVAEGRSPK